MRKGDSNSLFPYQKDFYSADEIRLVHSGTDFFDTLEEIIANARYTIHFQTYIFVADETGLRIASALQTAATRGVKVIMILDGFGSKSLTKKFILDLTNVGVKFQFFSPFLSIQNIYIGRRLHQKVIVADSKTALIGGINIGNEYKGNSTHIPWLDYAILVKGNVCEQADKICNQICEKEFRLKIGFGKKVGYLSEKGNNLIGFRQNNRLRKKNQICSNYVKNLRNAEKSILIVASYFLPGRKLRKALEVAAKKGVNIKIILSSVSDVPMFRLATSYLYSYLYRHGIEIYEWKKSILHGKLAVIDGIWTTVGSFNLNQLSAYGSIELNVEVLNHGFAKGAEEHLLGIIRDGCDKIAGEVLFDLRTRTLGAIAYLTVRTFIKFLALFPNMKYLYVRLKD